jgi:hypothetical protein
MDSTHSEPDANRAVTGLQIFSEEMQHMPDIPQVQMAQLWQQLYALTEQISGMTSQMTIMSSLLNGIDNRLQGVGNSITALTTRIDAR